MHHTAAAVNTTATFIEFILLTYSSKANLIIFKEVVQSAIHHILKDEAVVTGFKGHSKQADNVWMTQLLHLSFMNKIISNTDKQATADVDI